MYLLNNKLTAKQDCTKKLIEILIKASELVSAMKGCRLYAVSRDKERSNTVYITEIWESKTAHDESLKDTRVMSLIGQALPWIDGQPQPGQELEVIGGYGL